MDLSASLKPNSAYLKELNNKIENLKKSLKRPNEIIVKYNELLQSLRDETLLNKIENELEINTLEKNRTTYPWELISKPTLDVDPIYPKASRRIFISFILSIFISAIIVIF